MRRAIWVAALIIAAATAAHAEGTVKIPKDYNVLEVQDGTTTYKVPIEQLKKILRDKAKEAVRDGNAEITGTVDFKDTTGIATIRTISSWSTY